MTREEFAALLGTTKQNVAQVENCKDSSRKFHRKKEDEIIKVAELPPGYFVNDTVDVEAIKVSDEELFYRLFPNAKDKVNYDEALEFIDMISKFKTNR